MPDYITCRELIDFIADYRDGTLAAPQRREFDRHLAVCPDCVTYVDDYGALAASERLAFLDPEAPPPEDVPEDLVHGVLAALAVTAEPGDR